MGHLEFPGFGTLSWRKCQNAQNERDAVEDVEEEGREWQTDLPPCLQISEGHPASFPLSLMQRFQDNKLMGKTTTTWLTLAPELETELMWKSDYYPVSAHIPASEKKKNTSRETEQQEVGGKEKQWYTGTSHAYTKCVSLLVEKSVFEAVYFTTKLLAFSSFSRL